MLFRFSIDNNINAELRFHTTLVYTNVTDGAVKTLANTNLLQPASNRGNYLVHFNKPVVQQAVLLTANERMEKAMQEVDKGEYSNALHSLEDVRIYLRNHSRFTGGEEFARLDSVNANYTRAIVNARHLSADSVKKIQKVNKAENYKIRNKKQ